MDKVLLSFKRNGLDLDAEQQEQVKKLKTELSEICINFSKNMNEEVTTLKFSRDELVGLPDDFIESHEKDEETGKYIFTLKYPDLFPVIDKCKVAETRRQMEFANSSKLMEENVPLFERAIELRQQIAELMGYENHAAFKLEVKMAKEASAVMELENGLVEQLQGPADKELQKMLELKEKECKENGSEFDGKINAWDMRYYHHQLLETEFQVDDEEIRQYFPVDVVTGSLLEIYQELLGLKFTQVAKPHVWHEDVQLYKVEEANDGAFVGHFYLDLHPRDGKYTHAACFPLHPGYQLPGGERQFPCAAMVCNFTKPTEDKPSLLTHNEVVTYFHEFGHVMHGICTKAKFARFAGTAVERDFVEAPSQMLENWCWEPEILARLSGHYQDKSNKLPKELCDKMVAAKNVDVALLTLRQCFFGIFDMTVHTNPNEVESSEKLWGELRTKITKIQHTEGTNPVAAFGHVMGGYDAGYYGYIYSEVFSADMFMKFKESGVMDPETGALYRNTILATGGSRDSMDALVDFLGREPQNDAFLKVKGLA
eukprot:TRINITY_DN3270_c0_g1_i1.p2 TRINITY_DN3270_c0_g1~~TRINITY_DN3270_c0_g1_i1.p2  ORF type:complete len:541 (-),score=188.97 TRINITY_DN3270_c0_g1_i1:211-1833(-)